DRLAARIFRRASEIPSRGGHRTARLTAEQKCIAAAKRHMIAARQRWEDRRMRRSRRQDIQSGPVAGNGLLDRRIFLAGGAALAAGTGAHAEPLAVDPWSKVPGAGFAAYGAPSRFESKVGR